MFVLSRFVLKYKRSSCCCCCCNRSLHISCNNHTQPTQNKSDSRTNITTYTPAKNLAQPAQPTCFTPTTSKINMVVTPKPTTPQPTAAKNQLKPKKQPKTQTKSCAIAATHNHAKQKNQDLQK